MPVEEREIYPSGRNVKRAISFARNIEPIKVIYTSARASVRVLPVRATIFLAVMVKKRMFLRAQITASVQKRQVSVLKSKYSIYFESGLIIKQDTVAKIAAITRTIFLDTKLEALALISKNIRYIFE